MNSPIGVEAPDFNSSIRSWELGYSFGHSTNSRRQCIRSALESWNISLDEAAKEGGQLEFSLEKISSSNQLAWLKVMK